MLKDTLFWCSKGNSVATLDLHWQTTHSIKFNWVKNEETEAVGEAVTHGRSQGHKFHLCLSWQRNSHLRDTTPGKCPPSGLYIYFCHNLLYNLALRCSLHWELLIGRWLSSLLTECPKTEIKTTHPHSHYSFLSAWKINLGDSHFSFWRGHSFSEEYLVRLMQIISQPFSPLTSKRPVALNRWAVLNFWVSEGFLLLSTEDPKKSFCWQL